MKKRIFLLSAISVLSLAFNAYAVFDDFIGADHWDDVAMSCTASSTFIASAGPEQTVKGMTGSLVGNYYHGSSWGMWLSAIDGGGGAGNPSPTGAVVPAWISYNLGQSYQVTTMQIWNYNASVALNRGLKTVTILVSQDGTNWTEVYAGNLAKGTGSDSMPPTNTIAINRTFQFIVINCTANFSFLERYYGLSEVKWNILNPCAHSPKPADEATDVAVNPDLVWEPGVYASATQGHYVYFGDNYYDVLEASPSNPLGVYQGRHDANSFDPGTLAMDKTYYWRVDEANEANIWRGNIWSFTTKASTVIDAFENYPNYCDYWSADGTGTLSCAATSCGGAHSLRITYDNGYAPYYAGAYRSYSNFDMDSNGVRSLRLQYKGLSTNGTSHARLFIKVTDSAARIATVYNPDPNAMLAADCNMWFIDLAQFTTAPNPANFDLSHVSQIAVGVGDGQPGGAGEVLIDEVTLYPVGCGVYPQGTGRPVGDLNNDCYVDYEDLHELIRFWLLNNSFP